MELNAEIPARLGISPNWKPRISLIRAWRRISSFPVTNVGSYIKRVDQDNRLGIPNSELSRIGGWLSGESTVRMLEGDDWPPVLAQAIAYRKLGLRLYFFWHSKFRILELNLAQPLRMLNYLAITETMAAAIFADQLQSAVYLGYMAHAVLNRSFQLAIQYEVGHKRGHAFMLRLFADWQGFDGHRYPPWGYDESIYEGLLRRWRTHNADELAPWLLSACDRHTHQSKADTDHKFYDFATMSHFPLEILMVLRLRQLLGLPNPVLDHPLMAPPFDRLPAPVAPYDPDELMIGVLGRARKDWRDFDEATSLETLRAAATASRAL